MKVMKSRFKFKVTILLVKLALENYLRKLNSSLCSIHQCPYSVMQANGFHPNVLSMLTPVPVVGPAGPVSGPNRSCQTAQASPCAVALPWTKVTRLRPVQVDYRV